MKTTISTKKLKSGKTAFFGQVQLFDKSYVYEILVFPVGKFNVFTMKPQKVYTGKSKVQAKLYYNKLK
jgi:hypothetical protein